MEKYKNLQEDIENVTNKEVMKRTKLSMAAIGLLAAAVVMAIGGLSFQDPNSAMPTLLFTASALVFIGGIIKLFVHRTCYMFRPTNSQLKGKVIYFATQESDALQNCLSMKRFEELKKLKREKDSGVKLEAMVADDQKFVAIQISEYIPYSYEAVTPVMCFYGEEAKAFASYC